MEYVGKCKDLYESLNDEQPVKNTLAFHQLNKMIVVLQERDAYIAILGSVNIVVEKCPGFQRMVDGLESGPVVWPGL